MIDSRLHVSLFGIDHHSHTLRSRELANRVESLAKQIHESRLVFVEQRQQASRSQRLQHAQLVAARFEEAPRQQRLKRQQSRPLNVIDDAVIVQIEPREQLVEFARAQLDAE